MEPAAGPNLERPPELAGRLAALGGQAWRVAVRTLGRREGAEDVVQQAYLEALQRVRAGVRPDDELAWFLGVVANAARKHRRAESNLKKREDAAMRQAEGPRPGLDGELVAHLARALEALDEQYRLPVALCCEEGLTQRQAAAVLELPETTLRRRLDEGLDLLRKALARAGYAAVPAAVVGALAHTAPPVPATLVAALQKAVAGPAAAEGAGAAARHGAQAAAAAKGGLAMKIGLGLAVAGLVGGAAVWAVGGKSREGAAPPEQPRKFATPVWHPDAEWKGTDEVFAGCHIFGFLDGPKREVMSPLGPIPSLARCSGMRTAGRSDFTSYDPATERVHTMAGSTHGYLDGPFSRARFGGWDYTHRGAQHTSWSSDGRYGYFVESWNGGALRGLDLEKQEAFTATTEPIANLKGLAVDGKGRVLALRNDGELLFIASDSKKVEKKKLETPEGAYGGQTLSLALDPVHNRLYCSPSFKMSAKWYVWYWDLADGKHHGVLPMPQEGEPRRKGGMGASEAGSFKGTYVYPECYIRFGPDDPDYRFLYMSCTDQWAQYRLDLVKEEIHALSYDKAKDAFGFITSGLPSLGPGNSIPGVPPAADGDMCFSVGTTSTGHSLRRATRVK